MENHSVEDQSPNLREHLIQKHGEDKKAVYYKDLNTLELYHFMIHDQMNFQERSE